MVATVARLVPLLSASQPEVWPLCALALAVALAVTGCASSPGSVRASRPQTSTPVQPPSTARPQPPPEPGAPQHVLTGQASWYGKPHHGQRTASGEIYDMYALTAAHPSLPLGSRVRVTNLRNGRSVVVRINDRGPIVHGRIIDLSYAAAKRLEAIDNGAFAVRLHVLSLPGEAPVPPLRGAAGRRGIRRTLVARRARARDVPARRALTAEMQEGGRARSTRASSGGDPSASGSRRPVSRTWRAGRGAESGRIARAAAARNRPARAERCAIHRRPGEDRFSIVTTTMGSMPEALGGGSAPVCVMLGTAASAPAAAPAPLRKSRLVTAGSERREASWLDFADATTTTASSPRPDPGRI